MHTDNLTTLIWYSESVPLNTRSTLDILGQHSSQGEEKVYQHVLIKSKYGRWECGIWGGLGVSVACDPCKPSPSSVYHNHIRLTNHSGA